MDRPDALDISVVVTAHREGRLAHATLTSVWAAVREAEAAGLRCEVIAVLDRPDDATRDYFRARQPDARVIEVDHGDVGPARTDGARAAAGRFVNVVDGDDLFNPGWLWRAHAAVAAFPGPAVAQPSYVVNFDRRADLSRSPSTTEPTFRAVELMAFNPWVSCALGPRELFLRRPAAACPRGSGFGYEDWHWYCELVADGVAVLAVDRTCYFYRHRPGTRLQQDRGTGAVIRSSRLFDPAFVRSLQPDGDDRPLQPLPPPAVLPATPPAPARPRAGGLRGLVRRLVPGSVRRALRAAVPWRLRHAIRALLVRRLPPDAPTVAVPAAPRVPFPDWLVAEWKAAHAVEPLLFPERTTFDPVELPPNDGVRPGEPLGRAYVDLCRRLPERVGHVFLIAWLKPGGADLLVLHYVRALVEAGLADGLVVIATEPSDSPWADRLPPGVPFVEFGRLYAHLKDDERRALLTRFLLQAKPRCVNNVNSHLAYQALAAHGPAVAAATRLYNHNFCDTLTDDGRWLGYNRYFLPKVFDSLTAVLTDNQSEVNRLVDLFALDPAKFHTQYLPTASRPYSRRPARLREKACVEVLWAGRLDRQKRPDLLAAVAARLAGEPFRFHVYGQSVVVPDRAEVPAGPNVVYHGPYDGFGSLPTAEYDVYLYTSQYDGVPNALLEAMAAGLPVVASDVGGVAEVVAPGETGCLVTPYDDVDGFVGHLRALRAGTADADRLSRNAHALVSGRHSWARFVETVRATPGLAADAAVRRAA